MFENRVQKKTRGPKGNKIKTGCKELHNANHNDLRPSPDATTLIEKGG